MSSRIFIGELRSGWHNLAAAAFGLGLGIPCYTPLSSLFFRALEADFGWSKTVAAGALIALPITALVMPLAGLLIDRFGVRLISGISVLASSLSYFWLSRLSGRIDEYYLAIIALNVLGCATGPIAYTRLVAAQFIKARGAALAVAQFGVAFIAMLSPPLMGVLILEWGWRGGYVFLTLTSLAGGVTAQILMRPSTHDHVAAADGLTIRRAVLSRPFWTLGAAICLISIASLGLVSQFQSVLVDRGATLRSAAWMLSLLAASVMVSRLAVGRLLDLSFSHRWAAAVIAIAAIGAVLLFGSLSGTAPTMIAVILIGFSLGAELDLMSFFCARLFGLRHYASIYGLLSVFFYSGLAAGGIGYGVIHDATGTYRPALAATALLLLIASGLFLMLGETSRTAPAKNLLNDPTA